MAAGVPEPAANTYIVIGNCIFVLMIFTIPEFGTHMDGNRSQGLKSQLEYSITPDPSLRTLRKPFPSPSRTDQGP